MFTPDQLIGLVVILIAILLLAFLLQRLNSAIMAPRIERQAEVDPKTENKAETGAEQKKAHTAPRPHAKRRHGR